MAAAARLTFFAYNDPGPISSPISSDGVIYGNVRNIWVHAWDGRVYDGGLRIRDSSQLRKEIVELRKLLPGPPPVR